MSDGIIQVSDLLPKQIDKLADEVHEHWSQSGGVAGRIAWEGAGETVLKKIRDRLAFDPLSAFAKAWGELRDLRAFKDETKHPRDKSEPFELGPNKVKLDAYPQVILRVGPFRTPPLELMYTLEATFDTATLTIRNGAISAIAFGACALSGVLKTKDGTPLHEPCKLPEQRLPGGIEFSEPIPIP